MFGIGFGEFAIIFIVLIVAVGPEKLPTLMKTVGRTIRGLRQASRDIRTAVGIDEMMREDFSLNTPPPRKPPPPQGKPLGRGEDGAAAPTAAGPVVPPQKNAVPPTAAPPGPTAPAAQAAKPTADED